MMTTSSKWSHQAVNGDIVELEVEDESLLGAGIERATVNVRNLVPGSSDLDVAKENLPGALAPFVRSSFVELLPHGARNLTATPDMQKHAVEASRLFFWDLFL